MGTTSDGDYGGDGKYVPWRRTWPSNPLLDDETDAVRRRVMSPQMRGEEVVEEARVKPWLIRNKAAVEEAEKAARQELIDELDRMFSDDPPPDPVGGLHEPAIEAPHNMPLPFPGRGGSFTQSHEPLDSPLMVTPPMAPPLATNDQSAADEPVAGVVMGQTIRQHVAAKRRVKKVAEKNSKKQAGTRAPVAPKTTHSQIASSGTQPGSAEIGHVSTGDSQTIVTDSSSPDIHISPDQISPDQMSPEVSPMKAVEIHIESADEDIPCLRSRPVPNPPKESLLPELNKLRVDSPGVENPSPPTSERKADGRQTAERKADGRETDEQKADDREADEQKADDRKVVDGKINERGDEDRPAGEQRRDEDRKVGRRGAGRKTSTDSTHTGGSESTNKEQTTAKSWLEQTKIHTLPNLLSTLDEFRNVRLVLKQISLSYSLQQLQSLQSYSGGNLISEEDYKLATQMLDALNSSYASCLRDDLVLPKLEGSYVFASRSSKKETEVQDTVMAPEMPQDAAMSEETRPGDGGDGNADATTYPPRRAGVGRTGGAVRRGGGGAKAGGGIKPAGNKGTRSMVNPLIIPDTTAPTTETSLPSTRRLRGKQQTFLERQATASVAASDTHSDVGATINAETQQTQEPAVTQGPMTRARRQKVTRANPPNPAVPPKRRRKGVRKGASPKGEVMKGDMSEDGSGSAVQGTVPDSEGKPPAGVVHTPGEKADDESDQTSKQTAGQPSVGESPAPDQKDEEDGPLREGIPSTALDPSCLPVGGDCSREEPEVVDLTEQASDSSAHAAVKIGKPAVPEGVARDGSGGVAREETVEIKKARPYCSLHGEFDRGSGGCQMCEQELRISFAKSGFVLLRTHANVRGRTYELRCIRGHVGVYSSVKGQGCQACLREKMDAEAKQRARLQEERRREADCYRAQQRLFGSANQQSSTARIVWPQTDPSGQATIDKLLGTRRCKLQPWDVFGIKKPSQKSQYPTALAAAKVLYKKLVMRVHPDKCQLPNSKEAFHILDEAWKSLQKILGP